MAPTASHANLISNEDLSSSHLDFYDNSHSQNLTTCGPRPQAGETGIPIFSDVTFLYLIQCCCIGLSIITLVNWLFLTISHLRHWTMPNEQRQIIRIIFWPVVTSLVCLASVLDYSVSIYVTPISNMYESFCVAALFLLMNEWICPNKENRDNFWNRQERYTKTRQLIPGGSLGWFKCSWLIIFQYPLTACALDLVEIITQGVDRFCARSYSPKYGHIWTLLLGLIFVSLAISRLVYFFFRSTKGGLIDASHRPHSRFWSFKALVFLFFIQKIIFGFMKPSPTQTGKLTYDDIEFGIPALIASLEVAIVSIVFLWTWRPSEYKTTHHKQPRTSIFRAVLSALNLLDIILGTAEAITILLSGSWRGGSSLFGSRAQQQRATQQRPAIGHQHQAPKYSQRAPDQGQGQYTPQYGYEYKSEQAVNESFRPLN